MRAVLRRGLRDNRRAPLTWGGSLGAMSALMAAMWPSIEGTINDALENYPQGLKDAFNIRALDSLAAYIDAEMLSLIVPLAVAFLAVRVVSNQSPFMSLTMLADLLLEFGATEAINLDGGGSTSMVIRNQLVNKPSDATGERPVSDAILVFSR